MKKADRQTDRQMTINAITSVSPVEEYVARKEELHPWGAGLSSEYLQESITHIRHD